MFVVYSSIVVTDIICPLSECFFYRFFHAFDIYTKNTVPSLVITVKFCCVIIKYMSRHAKTQKQGDFIYLTAAEFWLLIEHQAMKISLLRK